MLRIEDTDLTREADGAIEQIQRSLDWLGLEFDESPAKGGPNSPYLQSERLAFYRETALDLVERGLAYRCYQTADELAAARTVARETDDPASATRLHRDLATAEVRAFEAEGRPAVIRLRVPLEGAVTITDLVRGEITWENRLLGDHVICRADGVATYQLANPLDDVLHGMTHVIRGEDLLPSTPRQVLLLEALGHRYPITAHLPMILGPDRKRLSKRHGAASVEEFRDAGYVPESVINYLALVGWSFDDATEIMTVDELVERFSIERVNPAPGVFDHQKLAWMNGVHLRGLAPARYEQALRGYLITSLSALATEPRLGEAVALVQEKVATLGEFEGFAGFLFRGVADDPEALAKVAATERVAEILAACADAIASLEPFTVEGVELALRNVCEELGVKPRVGLLPPRVAVSGRTVSPGLFESIVFLGREETIARLVALSRAIV